MISSSAGKWLIAAAIGIAVGYAAKGGLMQGALNEDELARLAANARTEDVLIYTTTDCPYCAQAKAWMNQYGFKFTECDAQVREDCARELAELSSGVPYLIVRGHHMKDGFDSDEFIAALQDGAE